MTMQPPLTSQPNQTFEQRWHTNYAAVRQFVIDYSKLPSGTAADPTEKKLGLWCQSNKQRQAGMPDRTPLPPERVALLEALPNWRWAGQSRPDRWRERYDRLLAFAVANGRMPYASATEAAEQELGVWRNMNKSWASDSSKRERYLSPERIALLEAVPGWDWGSTYSSWDARYADYATFVSAEGRLPQTQTENIFERDLAYWAIRQQDKHDGRPDSSPHTVEQTALLESLPGWRWRGTKLERWAKKLQPVLDLLSENPNATIHALPDEVADWLRDQARDWEQLSAEQQEMLQSLSFWPFAKRINSRWLAHYRKILLLCRADVLALDLIPHEEQSWLERQERRFSMLSSEQQEFLNRLKCYPLHEFSADSPA